MPAAQGTICRVQTARDGTPTQGWCYKVKYNPCCYPSPFASIQGECVPAGWRPRPVDGEWGHWNHWSECTKTCGIGVAFQSRQCDAPRPVHGGKYCLGVRRRYRTCNTEVCDAHTCDAGSISNSRSARNGLLNFVPSSAPSSTTRHFKITTTTGFHIQKANRPHRVHWPASPRVANGIRSWPHM